MVNLFQSFQEASDDDVRMQIAMFKAVTMTNIMKYYRQKTGKTATKIINKTFNFFHKDITVDGPEVKSINTLIEDNLEELHYIQRNVLEKYLREEIQKRFDNHHLIFHKSSTMDKLTDSFTDDERLSNCIIEGAVHCFLNIGDHLTSAQKADAIAIAYQNRIRENAQKILQKQTVHEAVKTEQDMDASINQMTDEEKRQVREALQVKKLTGKTMRHAILTTGIPATIIGATSGMGVFVATTTVMHAIFTTALGITLPFAVYSGTVSVLGFLLGPLGLLILGGIAAKQFISGNKKIDNEMMAQFVYISFVYHKRNFAPLEEELSQWKVYGKTNNAVLEVLQDEVARLNEEKASMVSKSQLKEQCKALRNAMEKELLQKESVIRAECRNKLQETENRVDSLQEQNMKKEKIIEEQNEIIEITKKKAEETLKEVCAEHEREINEMNKRIEQMREKQGSLVIKLERNQPNVLLRNKEIKNRLHEAVNKAKFEIDIISPWVTRRVLDEMFINQFRRAVYCGVTIKILYGIGAVNSIGKSPSDKDRNKRTDEAVAFLKKELSSNKLHLQRGNEHSKLIICDDSFYVITSFNPLSFDGNYYTEDVRGEIGELSRNKENLEQYRKKYFDF